MSLYALRNESFTKIKIMFRVIAFIIVLLVFSIDLSAQTLEGVVRDAKTQEPINHAVVYLNGTTSHTVTNADGAFKFVVKNAVNTNLIVSHVAYNEVSIANPFTHIPGVILLEEKENELTGAEVVAKKERYTRAQKMVAFREQFLGETEASKWCTIVNEDDIRLSYSSKTRTLTARSEVPIEVINSYLGYKVVFMLNDFAVKYSDRSINSASVKFFKYEGSPLFTDLQSDSNEYRKRRDESYWSSSTYFLKNLVNNTLKNAKFQLFINNKEIFRSNDYITVEPEPFVIGQKLIRRRVILDREAALGIPVNNIYGMPMYGYFRMVQNNYIESDVVFFTNSFSIDHYGNIDQIDKIMFTGSIGKQRLANMLPRDYAPNM